MLKLGILLITVAFFTGCTSSKENALMQSYQQKVDYYKQLQKTEKIQFFENNITKAVLTATYLYAPNFAKKDTRDEEFIVGVHLEDESEIGTEGIIKIFGLRDAEDIKKMRYKQKRKNKVASNFMYSDVVSFAGTIQSESKENKYGLTLQGQNAIGIKPLSKNDERLKDIAYVTDWGSYYLVTFEHTDSKHFWLVFNSPAYGKGSFPFAKVAKYIYTKKGF